MAPSLQAITERVCRYYGVTLEDLQGQGRTRKMAEVRGVICWHAQRLDSATVAEMAVLFGRDPSTLSRASVNIDKKIKVSTEFGEEVERILGNLGDNAITQA